MKISVVTPVYKAEKCLKELYIRLVKSLETITLDFEIIMVNDNSPQNDWEIIKQLSSSDSRVKGINFSRNFGQHFAITAGLDHADGDWIVVMDCDLQDSPEEIIKLYNKALSDSNIDVVFGKRMNRKDSLLKKMSSKLFYTVYDYFTDSKFDNTVANFSIAKRIVIKNFLKLREHNRSYPLFIKWVGFNLDYCEIEHSDRFSGKSSYNFKKLITLAVDSVVSQSNRPLRLSINFGFFISFISLMYTLYLVMRYFLLKAPVDGWTSIMVSLWCIGGLLFANMGLVGLYIGKIFNETKNRPLYIIKEQTNIEEVKNGLL